MQLITKGQANTLVFTLTEKVTLTNPVFLFELASPEGTLIYFLSADTSSYPTRYNRFTITEGTNSPLNGQIVCTTAGQYNYRIWEQTSSSNLDPANTTTLLEEGIIEVIGSSQTIATHQVPKEEAVIYGATQ